MNRRIVLSSFAAAAILIVLAAVDFSCIEKAEYYPEGITGAWKGKVQFKTGMYSQIKDLEFMRVFNEGGTMTESSNYDGAPPVPPAYGIWRKTAEGRYEAGYEFYSNNIPASFEELAKNGGFLPGGYGKVIENITLSDDGKSYKSSIKLTMFDKSGKQVSVDEADAEAERMEM
jgi:hypothetical protein